MCESCRSRAVTVAVRLQGETFLVCDDCALS